MIKSLDLETTSSGCKTHSINKTHFIKIVQAFHIAQDPDGKYEKTVELASEEPFLYKYDKSTIVDLVDELKSLGFGVKITTNGSLLKPYLSKLIGKVDRLRISFHSIRKDYYKEITGLDFKDRVQEGILQAKAMGFNVAVNRLLLPQYLDDFDEYLDFVIENSLDFKLLTGHFNFTGYLGNEKQKLLKDITISKIYPKLSGSPYEITDGVSRKQVFPLLNKAKFILRKSIDEEISKFPFCLSCENLHKCKSSNCLLPTAAKISPDYNLRFCSLKNSPAIDLNAVDIENISVENLSKYIQKQMHKIGLYEDKGFYIPIRATITSKCNFKCFFCHADGFQINIG
ncbi:MAG TPA: hypothetical protein ENO33_03675 [Hydrogenobaculum sp.]|nr:hypothetical protein [Hydrogenobaculum sp.]